MLSDLSGLVAHGTYLQPWMSLHAQSKAEEYIISILECVLTDEPAFKTRPISHHRLYHMHEPSVRSGRRLFLHQIKA